MGTEMLRGVDTERSEYAQHDSQDSSQGNPSPLTRKSSLQMSLL